MGATSGFATARTASLSRRFASETTERLFVGSSSRATSFPSGMLSTGRTSNASNFQNMPAFAYRRRLASRDVVFFGTAVSKESLLSWIPNETKHAARSNSGLVNPGGSPLRPDLARSHTVANTSVGVFFVFFFRDASVGGQRRSCGEQPGKKEERVEKHSSKSKPFLFRSWSRGRGRGARAAGRGPGTRGRRADGSGEIETLAPRVGPRTGGRARGVARRDGGRRTHPCRRGGRRRAPTASSASVRTRTWCQRPPPARATNGGARPPRERHRSRDVSALWLRIVSLNRRDARRSHPRVCHRH